MVKIAKQNTTTRRLPVSKRTSIGSGRPNNKKKRINSKPYRGQGRPS